MKKLLQAFILPLAFFLLSLSFVAAASLEDCQKEDIPADKIGECIKILSNKVADLGNQKKTLSSQIAQFDTQIKLTQTKITDAEATIAQLEKEIGVLGFRIGYITDSVGRLETLLKQRIIATYQQSFISTLEVILTSNDFSDLILRTQYIKEVQENDKKLLTNLLQTKSNYANQKDEREEKQAAIELNKQKLLGLKTNLDSQKVEKQAFLEVTKNDEVKFQRLLAQAQAEQAIIFGGGDDVFLRDVSQGDSIGSIASHSASPGCSTGAHLHFELHKSGSLQNPNDYLKSASYSYSYPPEQQGYYGTISPHGDLPWPLNEPVIIHQAYGSHPFAQSFYPSGSHNGIDMDSASSTVKAAKAGKLYGGSFNCANGKLFYAKVEHDDGLVSWYLHAIPN